jgi:predicted transcriptional regulator
MGAEPTSRVALLSIKPQYAEAIFAGRKTIEFRRSRLAADVEAVIVYATQPVGRIIGWFEVAEIVESTPTELWRVYSHRGGIDRPTYLAYFSEADRAFGIIIRRATRLPAPARLSEIGLDIRPPQSFRYLARGVAEGVLAA